LSDNFKISIIGAGNVAWHLAVALAGAVCVRQIVSRTEKSSSALASRVNATEAAAGKKCQCTFASSTEALSDDSDLYLIAVNDDEIARVVASTPDYTGIWAHTSGSVGLEVFEGKKTRYGSFYPLQTFSREIDVDVSAVPFFVEGSDGDVLEILRNLAASVSSRVYTATSERRRALHVAAVFACNFANQMWADADSLLRRQGLDITCLLPLIDATLSKLAVLSPSEAMTGPAQRGDLNVIRRHIDELPDGLKNVYRTVTQQILDANHPGMII
jgi:hypothetical protein